MMRTANIRQRVLVECSDPGTTMALEEELENVLRHIGFEAAL